MTSLLLFLELTTLQAAFPPPVQLFYHTIAVLSLQKLFIVIYRSMHIATRGKAVLSLERRGMKSFNELSRLFAVLSKVQRTEKCGF